MTAVKLGLNLGYWGMGNDADNLALAREADVRDLGQLQRVVAEGISEFGHIDTVVANAGIASIGALLDLDEQVWDEMIAVNLTGVWKTIKAAVPPMVERGQGGSVIITSSSIAARHRA